MTRALLHTTLVAVLIGPGALGAQTSSTPTFVDVWLSGPLDSIYNAEYQRLQEVCRGQGNACYAESLDSSAVRLAPVFTGPDTPELAGWLAARLRPRGRWPYAGLVFSGVDGREVPLMEDIGDWGYGLTLDLADARAGWIRPWLLEPAGSYWLSTESSPGFGIVEGPYGLAGRLWQLGPIPAESTGSEALEGDVYMILGVDGGVVSLRTERPEDMDCSGTADPSGGGPSPVIHRIPLEALLDASGRPLVEVAYPKGC